MRPDKIRVLILRGDAPKETPIAEIQDADIVLVANPNPSAGTLEVLKNRWGDRTHVVTEAAVEKFLDACGVRSAT